MEKPEYRIIKYLKKAGKTWQQTVRHISPFLSLRQLLHHVFSFFLIQWFAFPGGTVTNVSPQQKTLVSEIKNHEKPQNEIIQVRGPGNSAFLIEMLPSKDVFEVRFLLKNFILIKHKCRYEEPGISQFERHGFVLTKPITDYAATVKKAAVHVKEIEAEDVLELRKTKQLKFLCSPSRIFVTAYKLGLLGYNIDSSGINYYPKYIVGLKRNDRILCDKFLEVMNQLPNVVCIYDNIRRDLI